MPYNIFPGDQDWQSKVSWGGIFGRPPPIGNGPVIPTATPPTGSWADKLVSRLNSPAAQLGLRILANNRPGVSVGANLGQSYLGYQQDQAAQQQAELQRQLMQAQIAKAQQGATDNPESFGQLTSVMGPDGKMRFVQAGNRGTIRPVEGYSPGPLQQYGRVNPGDYTPESLDRYKETGDFKDLVRVWAPPAVSVQNVAGAPSIVDPSQRLGKGVVNPLSTPQAEAAAAAQRAGAEASARATGTAQGEAQGGIQNKALAALSGNDTLNLANSLIDVATGSGPGAAMDAVSGFFGYAPTGAQAIASLKVLQANLMTSMPRMEGPQSDADVKLYKQAAGQIGDPTIPREIKKAAIRTIRQLNNKYIQRASGKSGSTEVDALLDQYAPLGKK